MAIRNKLSDALKLTVKLLSALRDLKLKISPPTPFHPQTDNVQHWCIIGYGPVCFPHWPHGGSIAT